MHIDQDACAYKGSSEAVDQPCLRQRKRTGRESARSWGSATLAVELSDVYPYLAEASNGCVPTLGHAAVGNHLHCK